MRTLIALTAGLVLCPALASAATPPAAASGQVSDVRCLLTMTAVASDKAHQGPGMLGIYFFAGRILKANPNFDFAAGLAAEAPKMTQALLQTELRRCGPMVEQVSTGMRAAQQVLAPRPAPGAPGAPAAPGAPSAPTAPTQLVPMPGTGPAR